MAVQNLSPISGTSNKYDLIFPISHSARRYHFASILQLCRPLFFNDKKKTFNSPFR
jgi:hypothetical protein